VTKSLHTAFEMNFLAILTPKELIDRCLNQ